MKALLTFILLSLLSINANGQDLKKIRKVSFKGNNSLRSAKIEEVIGMKSASKIGEWLFKKEPDLFTMSLYSQDLDRIRHVYQMEGFLSINFDDPSVKITKNNKVKLTFNITEGNPIKLSKISYIVDSIPLNKNSLNKKTHRRIRLNSDLKIHQRFRDDSFYNDQTFINEEFNNMGYAYAQVKHNLRVDTINNKAQLNWLIAKDKLCYFGPITVQGNDRIPASKVIKQLQFKEGDLWSKNKIDETQKQIYNLGVFRVASIKTLMNTDKPDTLSTIITLKEAPRWTSRFGIGYGREDKLRAFADIQRLGFITKTGRISLYTKHSSLEPYNLQVKFTQPAVFFPFNSVVVNPFLREQDEPGYQVKRRGFNLTFLQHFSERFNSSLNFYLEDVDSDSTILEKDQFNTLDATVVDSYSKSGFEIGFIFYNGEPRLDPVDGYSLAINIKRNGTFVKESIPFMKSLIEYKKYVGVKPGLTIALKGKVGMARMQHSNDLIPIEERFYSGGSFSVRGWQRSQLGPKDAYGQPTGGNSLMEASIENRYSIGSKLMLAAFCDIGNVWKESFYYRFNDLHYAAGFSIRYKTAIGPVGVDFARPIFESNNTWQVHFNIGHPF